MRGGLVFVSEVGCEGGSLLSSISISREALFQFFQFQIPLGIAFLSIIPMGRGRDLAPPHGM